MLKPQEMLVELRDHVTPCPYVHVLLHEKHVSSSNMNRSILHLCTGSEEKKHPHHLNQPNMETSIFTGL